MKLASEVRWRQKEDLSKGIKTDQSADKRGGSEKERGQDKRLIGGDRYEPRRNCTVAEINNNR